MSQRVNRRWFWWLTVISIVSLVPPLVWILTWERHAVPTGDSWYFHWQAALIADGAGWFISPGPYLTHHVVVQSALHPPLWVLVLSFADTLGLQSYLSQLLVASVIGAGAVFVTGLAAREVAGPRAGLIAAGIAALYPNYWINDGLGLSETLILLLTAMLILVSFKLWREPSVRKAIALGLLCGLMALTRAEQVLLIVVVLVPLTLLLRGVALRRRLWYGAAGTLAAIAIMAPWLGFNLSRFTNPTLFSNDSGTTLAMANCRPAYRDGYLGSGDFNCLKLIAPVAGDESVQDAHERKAGLHYLNAHLGRLPVVVAARPAREFGLFAPLAQLRLESTVNMRPLLPAGVGLGMYYLLVVAAGYGAFTLRRRRLTLVPFVGILVELVVTAMATFGQTRYRAPFEVVVVVLGAVGVDAALSRWKLRTAAHLERDGSEPVATGSGVMGRTHA